MSLKCINPDFCVWVMQTGLWDIYEAWQTISIFPKMNDHLVYSQLSLKNTGIYVFLFIVLIKGEG